VAGKKEKKTEKSQLHAMALVSQFRDFPPEKRRLWHLF
jgi:hypothetical protein